MPVFDPPLTLLIVDDHFVFRAGLRAVLSLRKDFRVVAEADDAASALVEFRRHAPAVTQNRRTHPLRSLIYIPHAPPPQSIPRPIVPFRAMPSHCQSQTNPPPFW